MKGLVALACALPLLVAFAPAASFRSASGSAEFKLSAEPMQGAIVRGTAPAGTVRLLLNNEPLPLAEDGEFLLGFDRDAPSSFRIEAELQNGGKVSRDLTVAPRSWAIENINIARHSTEPDEAYLRKRAGETARIESARAVQTGSTGWRQKFIWPARGRISGRFGSQRVYRGEPAAFHSGVDIAPGAGAPVVAPADGTVVLAGPPMFSLEGNLVIIDHGMGLNSAFLHLSTYSVKVGEKVRQDQMIGTVGSTGRATGPHLHWSVKWRDTRVDPELMTGPQHV